MATVLGEEDELNSGSRQNSAPDTPVRGSASSRAETAPIEAG